MTGELHIAPAAPHDADEVAAWFIERSALPEQRCLHTWTGQPHERAAAELRASLGRTLSYVVVREDAVIRGVMGAAWTPGRPHAWLRGPIVDEPDEARWHAVASALAEATIAHSPRLSGLAAYPHVENRRLIRFYREQGLSLGHQPSHVYVRDLEHEAASDAHLQPLSERLQPSFRALFLALFPRLGHMTDHLAAGPHDGELVRLAVGSDGVEGFVVARERGFRDPEIVALGVSPAARRRGLGARLLGAATAWAAGRAQPRVELTVLAGAGAAVALYEKLGWKRFGTGIDMAVTV
jgi:GNAT superfamily N-acetyltransferase